MDRQAALSESQQALLSECPVDRYRDMIAGLPPWLVVPVPKVLGEIGWDWNGNSLPAGPMRGHKALSSPAGLRP